MRFEEWQDRKEENMRKLMEEYAGMIVYVIAGLMLTGVFWQLLERVSSQ